MPEGVQAAIAFLGIFGGIGMMASMIIRAKHRFGGTAVHSAKPETNENDVRLAALKTYEKLAKEKFDVLRRALDLGWHDADLKALDARLEQLVGREGIERIARGELLTKDMEQHALAPEQELAALKRESER